MISSLPVVFETVRSHLAHPLQAACMMLPRAFINVAGRQLSERRFSVRALRTDGLLVLLVTDLESFTTIVESLGDAQSQVLIRRHNHAVRRCVKLWNGCEVTHTGDGLVAAFRSVSAALTCAGAILHALSLLNTQHPDTPLRARVGVHAGEPLPEEDRLFGHCVNVSMRVCMLAPACSVLVTEVVVQLAAGRFAFAPGRSHVLKGIAEPLRLYRLQTAAPSV
jgi:class 3 adenylate cyclase